MNDCSPQVVAVLALVRERSGLLFPEIRRGAAASTIAAFMAERHLRSDRELLASGALPALLERLVVHESFFDRDVEQLAFVDEVVLPELAQLDGPLRVWSAACAGGEEVYTLAFMLATRGLLERASVLGTDLSDAALSRARAGRYRAWSTRLGPSAPAARYLERSGTEFQVPARFLELVKLARLNLVEDPFPSGQHLIFCRNVLIYFDAPSIEVVAAKLAGALAPGGWLAVGPSEPRLDGSGVLEAIILERGVFYRHRGHAPRVARPWYVAPPVAPVVVAPVWTPPPVRAREPAPPPPAIAVTGAAEIRRLADVGESAPALALLVPALEARPLDAELHFLHAVLLSAHDIPGALAAIDRCVYLDPTKVAAHLLAASLRRAQGKPRDARRAYGAARALLRGCAPADLVPWVDEAAGSLTVACERAMEILDGAG